MKDKAPKLNDGVVWCKPDRPVHVRAPLSLLFGLKRLLVGWDFDKKTVYIDEDSACMEIYKVPVLVASSKEGKLCMTWLNKSWEAWGDLHNNGEFQDLIKTCNVSLEAGNAQRSKGVGKGSLTT